jgi:hypothetical protein
VWATPDPAGLGQEEAIRILAGVPEPGDEDPLLLSIDLIEDDYPGRGGSDGAVRKGSGCNLQRGYRGEPEGAGKNPRFR